MTMFHGETVGNDTGEYVNFLGGDASMKIMPRYWKEVDLKRDMLLSFLSALTLKRFLHQQRFSHQYGVAQEGAEISAG